MKKLLALFTIVATQVSIAQQSVEPPLVSTTGTAEIQVVPDLADLYFDVEVRDADLAAARTQQNERTTKVLAALRASGIEEKDLKAADISITPNYTENQRDRVETTKIRFFSVSQGIAITLRDLKKVPDTIAAAVTAGATGVRSVTLRTTELRKHRDTARASAVKAAKEKAIALANELGAKVGKPYKISEETARDGYSSWSNSVITPNVIDSPIFVQGSGAAFASGTISITASVGVSFLLE